MTWNQVRKAFPRGWVLVEAIQAHSEANRRILDNVAVVGGYGEDSGAAWRRYLELHRAEPERELYFLHTSKEEPNIEERHWLGIIVVCETVDGARSESREAGL